MKIIDGIRTTGKQKLRITAYNGDIIEMVLYFLPAVQGWKMDILSGTFDLKGFRIFNSLNMTCNYSNLIPFGIACIVSDDGDPFLITDFSQGRCQLAILSPDEISQVNDFYIAQRTL